MNIVEHYITRNYTQGRPGLDMTPFFVVHTYNGKGTFLNGWFQNNNLGVSSNNAALKDGTIERLVRREDTAHHAGNWWANVRSIGIEHQDDGNPSDSARTNELYEATCQDIAQVAFELGHKVLNESNIKPHWEFSSTGCPGGLDINRIRQRSNEILQAKLAPAIPDWKKNAKDVGLKNYKVQKNVDLIDISDGRVIKTVPKGSDIGVRYEYNGFLITEYSYNNTFDNGFKKEDLEYIENDNIYYIYKDNQIIQNFTVKDEAFNFWYDNKESQVIFNNQNITSEFLTMANKLDEQIETLRAEKQELSGKLSKASEDLETSKDTISTQSEQIEVLQLKIDTYKKYEVIEKVIQKIKNLFIKKK